MAGEKRTDPEIRDLLARARTVAVLGAHVEPTKPARYVPDYLHKHGYRVIPVNPAFARKGLTAFGERFRASLEEIEEAVDLVDVFRRSEDLAAHVPDILAMKPLPAAVWFQMGIRDDAVAARLIARGIDVVQDLCTLAEHGRLGIGAIPARPPAAG